MSRIALLSWFIPLFLVSLVPWPARAQDDAAFTNCLSSLRAQAVSRKIPATTFERLTAGLAADAEVLTLLDRQPEFVTPVWDYLAGLVDDERITDGRAMLQEWQATLQRIEAEYGVPAETVVAIWGIESNYGRTFGRRSVVRSLATLSCFGRRQEFFRNEFLTTLQILEQGHIEPEALVGSWAGAFGHTQFMPSTFERIAVDFDGDGRRDLLGSVPDALASTANYLRRSGWRTGQGWGFEVRLPDGFDAVGAGRRNKQALSNWIARGVRSATAAPLPDSDTQAGLILPAGPGGPAFLVLRNFDALYSYNAAESYALAIAHLSDRLRGAAPFSTAWPTDDPGLSRAERREVQALLRERGHDIGEVDGLIGANTRRVIQALQPELGLAADGRAGKRLLEVLRATR